jgi:hypothetical protein
MPIHSWDQDQGRILESLREKATLKLCAKVLDEPLLVEGWIQHHSKIVGCKNLIIADNGSTDPHSLEVYEKYNKSCTIFRFNGPHNEIHWHPRFGPLFEAIKESSEYFSFIDVDERLVWIDSDAWAADESIVQKIVLLANRRIIPATWLINTLNSYETFTLLDSEGTPKFQNNLRWGKPILPAPLVGIQDGIHNAQFDRFAFSTVYGVQFFLLHLTQFPQRRIAANRNKLISRGVIDRGVSIEDIIKMSFETPADASFMRLVTEIRVMSELITVDSKSHLDPIASSHLTLHADGSVKYGNENARNTFTAFLQSGPDSILRLLGGDELLEDQVIDATSLLATATQLRDEGRFSRAERLFRRGVVLYPTLLDRHKSPLFLRELIKLLLDQKDVVQAEKLIPRNKGEIGGDNWHQILFARACSAIGDNTQAQKWWRLVLQIDPENKEALAAMSQPPSNNSSEQSQPGGTTALPNPS